MTEQYLGLIKELTYQQALELANGNQLYVKLNFGYGVIATQVNSVAHYNEVIADYLEQVGELMDYDCFVCSVPAATTSDNVIATKPRQPIRDIEFDLATLSEIEVDFREADFFYTLNQAATLADKIDRLVGSNQPVPGKLRAEHDETLKLADRLGFEAIWD